MNIPTSILTLTAGLLLLSAGGLQAAVVVTGSTTGTLPSNSLGIDFSNPANSSVYTTTTDNFNERNVRSPRTTRRLSKSRPRSHWMRFTLSINQGTPMRMEPSFSQSTTLRTSMQPRSHWERLW